jgi:hypothetical protein
MTKRLDRGFTARALMALVSAMSDQNYKNAETIVAALAREHGISAYAKRVMIASTGGAIAPTT